MNIRIFHQTPKCPELADPTLWVAANRKLLDDFSSLFTSISRAVGLAANQCEEGGEVLLHRFFAMAAAGGWTLCLNPVIVEKQGYAQRLSERCLSWPTWELQAMRYPRVDVSYMDGSGSPVLKRLYGLEAQIFQHELDHLEGVTVDVVKEGTRSVVEIPGRNDPCPCGSGKKFKKCCMFRA